MGNAKWNGSNDDNDGNKDKEQIGKTDLHMHGDDDATAWNSTVPAR